MPAGIGAGRTSYETASSSVFSAKFHPARSACRLASTIAGRLPNLSWMYASAASSGRWNSHDVTPRQKKLRQRNVSRADNPSPCSAVVVSFVMSMGKTCQRLQRAVLQRVRA